jgi:hypothetical protein
MPPELSFPPASYCMSPAPVRCSGPAEGGKELPENVQKAFQDIINRFLEQIQRDPAAAAPQCGGSQCGQTHAPGGGPVSWTTGAAQTTTPTTVPSEPTGASAEQLKINDDKLCGVGDHPLGPDDDLLPPEEQGMSVEQLKSLTNPDGTQMYGLMANLGNQEGVRDKLKEVVGDVDNDPKAFARGEAYLQKIKNMPNPDGSKRPDEVMFNGKMEGATKDGDIRAGTEMAILKDSFKGGPQVSDDDAPDPIDKNTAYEWLNGQKTLAPTNDKHVVNGGNFRSDAQVMVMDVNDTFEQGFQQMGDGLKKIGDCAVNFAEGAVDAIGGAFKVVGGALTFNPDLIKEGADGFQDGISQSWESIDTGIKGVGDVIGGFASVAVNASPAGMALNLITDNAASRLAAGVFEGTADFLVKGKNSPVEFAHGIAEGDVKKVGKAVLDFTSMASALIPGAGQANAARVVATNLLKEGAKDSVKDEAKHQYAENKNDPQKA